MFLKSFTNSHGTSLAARTIVVGTALATGVGLVGSVSAGVIYQDNFAGSATTLLNGQAPQVANGTSATWTAASGAYNTTIYNADGSVTAGAAGGYANAFLAFTPSSGNIYTLSAGLNFNPSYSGWLMLGFLTSAANVNQSFIGAGGPWIADTAGGGVYDGNTTGNFALTSGNGVAYDMQVVLDTRHTDWTVQFFNNNANVSPVLTYGTNPTISYVGLGDSASGGQFSNFSLTSAPVPEPAALGLVAAASGLGLLLLKRRLRA